MYFWIGVILFLVALGGIVYSAIDWRVGDWVMLSSLILMLFSTGLMILQVAINDERDKNACESIGGKYVVIGTDEVYVNVNGVIAPSEIDIYGCTKE